MHVDACALLFDPIDSCSLQRLVGWCSAKEEGWREREGGVSGTDCCTPQPRSMVLRGAGCCPHACTCLHIHSQTPHPHHRVEGAWGGWGDGVCTFNSCRSMIGWMAPPHPPQPVVPHTPRASRLPDPNRCWASVWSPRIGRRTTARHAVYSNPLTKCDVFPTVGDSRFLPDGSTRTRNVCFIRTQPSLSTAPANGDLLLFC